MSFYSELSDMVKELLLPSELGQGPITIARLVPGTPNPAQPWVPVAPTRTEELVNQIGEVKAEYSQGGTIITTDLAYMIAATSTLTPRPGDTVERDGQTVGTIVHAEPFPPHGEAVYSKVFVNR